MADRVSEKILFISLGCDKNLADSEEMLGLLTENGYVLTDREDEADIIIINTCCFIHDAKEESIQTILEMAQWKESGRCRILAVTGCLAQRYQKEIMQEIPEVDLVLGTASTDAILEGIAQVKERGSCQVYRELTYLPRFHSRRMLTEGGHHAHLKIAEGCDKNCTYCIIPKIRGPYRSVPMEDLIRQAEDLAEQGVKELILVAQETTIYGVDLYGEKKLHELLERLCRIPGFVWIRILYCYPVKELILVAQETTIYGVDLYGEKKLHELLERLCRIPGFVWIRILYCYPEEIYDELIQVMKREKKICHYLDMPIQHASDRILRRMGRRTSRRELEETVTKLRREIPDIVLRTTLITGFPGETREDHEELLEFVNEMEFDRLGVFTYSPEEDTPAERMPDQIEEEVKLTRKDELMELQQEISLENGENRVGQTLLVMIEGKVADEEAYVGRTYADAPQIDGYIFINTERELISGDFARVRVTGALEYDLIGELEDEYTE